MTGYGQGAARAGTVPLLRRSAGTWRMTARWRSRGRRLCPRRRPWLAAALAEASVAAGSLAAVYASLDADRRHQVAAARALAGRRRRDFEDGLCALDGHLHQDTSFRRFVAERPGLRLPTPAEAAASWPEPEPG